MAKKSAISRHPSDSDVATSGGLRIVGIGASAGGLDAFKSFFANMPADSGMAFVLVQHLSPDHKSLLSELLGKVASMDVVDATDGVRVVANRVFVIPPNSTLRIVKGCLRVAHPAPPRDRRRPIDAFFNSLAEDQSHKAIGIVLAGTGSDGSQGLAAIKDRGGLTLAQAEFDHHALPGMPQSANSAGHVDEVLAVEAMPARLIAHLDHLRRVAESKDGDQARGDAGSHLATILRALRKRSGHDFGGYKEKTVVRRLRRRMQVLHLDTPEAYIERYLEHPEELDLLLRELLIGVTAFFRDTAAFEALNALVLRDFATRGGGDEIRIWTPGCATGEEVFSIAILLRETMNAGRPLPEVQIFGTDIDDRAITVARAGRYRKPLAGVSPERMERWFIEDGDGCCVVPEIRDMCVFSTHSVIKHPPFSKLDLISCRNMLIYLDADMQDRVMRTFHYALKPGGRLFLGSSESVTRATNLFSVADKKHRIFARREVDIPILPGLSTVGRGTGARNHPIAVTRPSDERIDRSARRVTEKHAPPYVVIDGKDHIVRFSGPAMGRFVEPSPGAPTFALFDILRKTLRPTARAVLREARTANGPVRHDNLPVRIEGHARLVTLIAEPLAQEGEEAGLTVLLFLDAGPGSLVAETNANSSDVSKALEQELRTTKAQLQSTIEDLEIANEELKSSNEEHQSVNEELQSSNEELETAKEEMQSVNEELQTINAEMVSKNEQLTHLNSDLKNLLESTEIATLFLDGRLRVKSFTPGVTDLFHVRDADIGRPIAEVVNLLDYADLQADVRTVLRKLTILDRQVTLHGTKSTFILRIRPYRTIDNVIDGVVLTFVDMTLLQAAQEAVQVSDARYRMLFEFIDEGFCILEKLKTLSGGRSDYRYLSANAGFERQAGVGNVVGRTFREIFPAEPEDWLDIYDAIMVHGEPLRFERNLIEQGRTLELFAFRFEEEEAHRLGVIFLDVTERKRHDAQQDLLIREMDHRVKNLFAVVGGMVSLSARSTTTSRELADTILGRLGALASAHQLIRPKAGNSQPAKQETSLLELVRKVLAPHIDTNRAQEEGRVTIDGAEIMVGAQAATNLALVVHELATNAAKYGALSVSGGSLRISWAVTNQRLAFSWEETGGPPIAAPPEREGFGSQLARRSVNGQLAGVLDFHWNPDGLIVHLSAPAERLTL